MASRPDRLRAESYISLRCLTGASGLRASPKLYGQDYDNAPDGAIPGKLERFGLMDDALRLSRMLGSALGLYSISRGLIIPTKRVQSLRSRSPICRRDCWLPQSSLINTAVALVLVLLVYFLSDPCSRLALRSICLCRRQRCAWDPFLLSPSEVPVSNTRPHFDLVSRYVWKT